MSLIRGLSGAVVLSLFVCTFGIRFPTLGEVKLPAINLPAARIQETARKAAQITHLKSVVGGVQEKVFPGFREAFEKTIPTKLVNEVASVAKSISTEIKNALLEDFNKTPRTARAKVPFGPHLLVNPEALELASQGAAFEEATIKAAKGLKLGRSGLSKLKGLSIFKKRIPQCRFRIKIKCNPTSKYRTIDGSCNNLNNPVWGRANTPFERFLPEQYGLEGIFSPRAESVLGGPLPLARVISTEIHSQSVVADLHPDITHMTMEFGQLISHDVNRNTLSSGYNGGSLSCCTASGGIDNSRRKHFLGCLPIEIPANDPFFSQFHRTCMNFVRAQRTTNLDCDLGPRQQLNQVTHYIDASTVYGSDTATMNGIRTMTNGLLKVTNSGNGDLLPQNPTSGGCRTTGSQHCFKAGDVRVNQQPGLMSMHTLFLREHNRIAISLKALHPTWNDEKLFQEARKIVGAEMQHVTYTEYLPTVLGNSFATSFGFAAQPAGAYYTGYDSSFNAAIRNGFAAAAYRFGHSTVRDHVAPGQLFKDHFLNPALIYQSLKGPSHLVESLIEDRQQKTDNLLTDQLTNHLFERAAGTGMDLAATNIQRGRDHGLANYNFWRLWCNYEYVNSFNTGLGGLVDHTPAVAALLASVYSHPDDIDIWTGIVTEIPLEGKALGPTGACIVARQFWVLKQADRFYYETNNIHARFEIGQLNEIRKTTLARIICDNTDLTSVQKDVFQEASASNPTVLCSTLKSCTKRQWGAWTPYTRCTFGVKTRRRRCSTFIAGVSCSGSTLCTGPASQLKRCSGGIGFPFKTPKLPNFPRIQARFSQ